MKQKRNFTIALAAILAFSSLTACSSDSDSSSSKKDKATKSFSSETSEDSNNSFDKSSVKKKKDKEKSSEKESNIYTTLLNQYYDAVFSKNGETMRKLIAPEAYWIYMQEQYDETEKEENATYNQIAANLVDYWKELYGSNVQVTFSINNLEQQSDATVAELNTALEETGCVAEQVVILTVTQKFSGSAGEAETIIQPTMIQVDENWYLIDPAIPDSNNKNSSETLQ